jgi:hypothetical protein
MKNDRIQATRSITLLAGLTIALLSCTEDKKTPYEATTLGEVKVTVFDGNAFNSQQYASGAMFYLAEESIICLERGDGKVFINSGQGDLIVLHNKKPCEILKVVKSQSYSTAIANKFAQVFPKKEKGEGSIIGSTRASDVAYTDPIYLNDKAYLIIDNPEWVISPSRLPLVFKLISPKGDIALQFESDKKGFSSFIIPRTLLKDKDGYTLLINNNRGNTLVESRFFLREVKGKE